MAFSKYKMEKLIAYATVQPGYAFKSDRFTDDLSDVSLVKGENVQQGYIDWAVSKRWPRDDRAGLEKYVLETGDIVLAMDRPWVTSGLKWAYIKKHDPESFLVQRVARLRGKKGLDQTYFRCLISSRYFSNYIQPIVTGVNVPHISGKQIGDFRIPLPKPEVQKKIAAILSAYDDLIENNKRRIALLEQMAEEIYREWFVRMRFPGHENSKFEKGVPVTWNWEQAAHFFDVVKGKSYGRDEISDDPDALPFVTLKSFFRGGGYRADGLKKYSGKYKEDQLVHKGDVVMAVTDMTQNREVIGRVARLPDFGEAGAVISLDVIKLVPKQISKTFLYSYMRYSGFGNFIKEFANGANVLHLKPDLLTKQTILIPPESLRQKIDILIEPAYHQMDILNLQTQRLIQSRDKLLPRLISGKLSVEGLDIQFPPSMQEDVENPEQERACG